MRNEISRYTFFLHVFPDSFFFFLFFLLLSFLPHPFSSIYFFLIYIWASDGKFLVILVNSQGHMRLFTVWDGDESGESHFLWLMVCSVSRRVAHGWLLAWSHFESERLVGLEQKLLNEPCQRPPKSNTTLRTYYFKWWLGCHRDHQNHKMMNMSKN